MENIRAREYEFNAVFFKNIFSVHRDNGSLADSWHRDNGIHLPVRLRRLPQQTQHEDSRVHELQTNAPSYHGRLRGFLLDLGGERQSMIDRLSIRIL